MFSKLCNCERLPCYNGNPSCSLCLSEQAKQGKKEKAKPPKNGIKQVSKKQAAELAALAKIKREFLEQHPYCFTTGEYVTAETCDLSHIIGRGNKKYVTERINLVLEKREPHYLWEHFKAAYANQYPAKWNLKLERARQLNETEYEKLKQKAE